MKKEYIKPILSTEIIYITDSMCSSVPCVGEDNVDDTTVYGKGYGEGYVYMKDGQPYYCYGLGDL